MKNAIAVIALLTAPLLTFAGLGWLAAQDDRTPSGGGSSGSAMSGVADVVAFGAKGDGMADDTWAIQRAVDSGRGEVRFGKGVYRLTNTVMIDLDKLGYTSLTAAGTARVVMAGPGPAFKFVGTHFQSADPGGFADNVWQRQRMPLVDGLAIQGAHPEAIGITAAGTMQLTVTRVHLRGLLHGIQLIENNRNVIIADSHIYENRGVGIYYDDVNLHQSNITNCHISYNHGGGVVSRRGNVRNIHISGCDLESNMSPDAPPTANVLIDCSGSQAGTGEVAITGCTIQHNNPSPDSANIRILGRSEPSRGLDVVQEGNVTITGNVLSDVQVNLHLRDCRGVTVTGNTFWQGYAQNLLIEDCNSVVIGPNNFDRNPRYNYGNTSAANNGLVIRNCSDCTLTGLHISQVWREPAGLLIENGRRINVVGCTILDCDNAALVLKQPRDCRVSDCLLRDDRPAANSASLVLVGGERNMVVDNLLGSPPQIEAGAAFTADNVVP